MAEPEACPDPIPPTFTATAAEARFLGGCQLPGAPGVCSLLSSQPLGRSRTAEHQVIAPASGLVLRAYVPGAELMEDSDIQYRLERREARRAPGSSTSRACLLMKSSDDWGVYLLCLVLVLSVSDVKYDLRNGCFVG